MTKNVLITGANSPLGKYIAKSLHKYGDFNIIGISRSGRKLEHYKKMYKFNFLKVSKLPDEKFEYVFHVASAVPSKYKKFEDFININVEGPNYLINSLNYSSDAKIINISSSSVYNDPLNEILFENSNKETKEPYGLSKLMFENELNPIAISKDISILTLRVPVLLVPGIKNNFISNWLAKLIKGDEITLFNPESKLNAVIDGDSILKFSLNYLKQGFHLITNVASKKPISILQTAQTLARSINKDLKYKTLRNDRINQNISTALAEQNSFIAPDVKDVIVNFARTSLK